MTGDLLLAITTDNCGRVFIEDSEGTILETIEVDDEPEAVTLEKVLDKVESGWMTKFSE